MDDTTLFWRRVTGLVIVGVTFLVAAYDLLVYLWVGNDATLSRVLLDASEKNPTVVGGVCLLTGILLAHLFGLTQTRR